MYIYKEAYHMELDHMIIAAGKSKICRVSQQAGDPELML